MSIKISYEEAYKILDIIQNAIGEKIKQKMNDLELDDKTVNELVETNKEAIEESKEEIEKGLKTLKEDISKKKTENMKEYRKEYYKNNKDKFDRPLTEDKKEYYKKYYKDHPEKYDKPSRYNEHKEEVLKKSAEKYKRKKEEEYIAKHGSLEGFQIRKKTKNQEV